MDCNFTGPLKTFSFQFEILANRILVSTKESALMMEELHRVYVNLNSKEDCAEVSRKLYFEQINFNGN